MKWDAGQYLKFEAERTQPSVDLISRLTAVRPKKILDIGCGPGNSTRLLKKRYPDAEILGIDKSPEMIKTAERDNPDIEFKVADDYDYGNYDYDGYDIVFSNAAIQWMPNHEKLLPEMLSLLKPGGMLAVQTPMNHNAPVNEIIQDLLHSPEWKDKFAVSRVFYNLKPSQYYDLLLEISSDFTMWETSYYHLMTSYEDILEWYRGTGLRPYLEQLTAEDGKRFENEIRERLDQYYSKQKDGKILLRFPRLFFTAKPKERK